MGDLEPDPVRAERPIDERQRRRVGAVGAVDASDRRAANRELVGVGLAAVGSPAAAIVVRVRPRARGVNRAGWGRLYLLEGGEKRREDGGEGVLTRGGLRMDCSGATTNRAVWEEGADEVCGCSAEARTRNRHGR